MPRSDDTPDKCKGANNQTRNSSSAAMKGADKANDTSITVADSEDIQNRHTTATIRCNTSTIFVGGLHPRIGDIHLQKLFAPYGTIVRVHLVRHKPGATPTQGNPTAKSKAPLKHAFGSQQSKGYAFVEYDTIESAQLAMERLDGKSLLGKNLVVRPSKKQSADSASALITTTMTADEARQEYKSVQSKIDSLKKALEQKKKGM